MSLVREGCAFDPITSLLEFDQEDFAMVVHDWPDKYPHNEEIQKLYCWFCSKPQLVRNALEDYYMFLSGKISIDALEYFYENLIESYEED